MKKYIYIPKENKIVYNIDFDGVINSGNSYENPEPNLEVIEKVREIYYSGDIIIVWTARLWNEASFLVGWLITNSVPFHGIRMDKGGSNCYVDDRIMSIEDFINKP